MIRDVFFGIFQDGSIILEVPLLTETGADIKQLYPVQVLDQRYFRLPDEQFLRNRVFRHFLLKLDQLALALFRRGQIFPFYGVELVC
jgi:hypothetical protein